MNRWRKFFLGSKHVSSQIWCYLKLVRWRVRWRDVQMKKIFFGSEHVSSQIWCYLKLVRWRDEEWDEEMNRWRKFFWVRTCIKPNLVLSKISEMKRWKKNFLGPNMYQSKSGVKNFSLHEWGGGLGSKKLHPSRQTNRHTYGHHSD